VNESQNKADAYLVVLKTGDHAVFTNNDRRESYLDRLVAGIYGIVGATGHNNLITPETVLGISQVCSHCHYDYEMRSGSNVCPECGERTFVSALEF
jgi:hypothetical protein